MTRELVHDPNNHACNMEWTVVENGETIYRGPEWAARLRVNNPDVDIDTGLRPNGKVTRRPSGATR